MTVFEMTTVTFSQCSSPFPLIRTLHQLITDKAELYPDVKQIILRDMYVDDVATGTNSEKNALRLY